MKILTKSQCHFGGTVEGQSPSQLTFKERQVEFTNLQKSVLTDVKVQRNDFWSFQMFALSLFQGNSFAVFCIFCVPPVSPKITLIPSKWHIIVDNQTLIFSLLT